jgi:TPR repeat protein
VLSPVSQHSCCGSEYGVGTVIVRSEALRWFHEAAAQGHQEAEAALKRLKIEETLDRAA